ncbi:hypothetical protein DMB92_00940 [Campylobacter sp. MIT 99-7217]|uniref:hypothetical protein n=1 Tax=Campylobacter sp. MIT 99-7217 TaxID=535091 RepID=UPI0011592E1D|nr:hypothetical protein [Campylobacter sp. MIT 99-7217]TQR34563.1 hypothetical protein DMB92_00940 [Campylobacter sp. MIT 99-7217]
MKVDNFLANYNSNAILNDSSKRSYEASKNYSKAEFSSKDSKKEEEFDKALKEQTDAFESFLIKTVLDISMKNKASIFEKDASDDIYSSMYNDTMSKALSGGIGFSQLLFDFLKERG